MRYFFINEWGDQRTRLRQLIPALILAAFCLGVFSFAEPDEECVDVVLRESGLAAAAEPEDFDVQESIVSDADEVEYKFSLTRLAYEKILRLKTVEVLSVSRLRNYYFDTKSLDLFDKKFRLRLRSTDRNAAEITLKLPSKNKLKTKNPPKVKREVSSPIDIEELEQIVEGDIALTLPPKIERLLPVASSELDLLGSIKTRRSEVRLPNGLHIEVDRFQVLDEVLYEIEVEVPEERDPQETHDYVRRFLRSHGVLHSPTDISKAKRFFKKIRSLQ